MIFCNLRRQAVMCVLGALAFFPAMVPAQMPGSIVGTWALVSSVTEKDGQKTEQFGAGAKGMLIFDESGHFMLTIIGPHLPRFSSNNRANGTAEENRAVVSASIAMLGTYAFDGAQKSLVFHVDSATFPNWNGTQQQRLVSSLTAHELRYVTPAASSGGVGTVTWSRVK